ncbi:ATP-binding cassette domain-containing protein [Paenibacillus paeoniae]|uniref:ATP-binding cassette domain-containing protein n=1 Tax=Paenibacillus paeoniae TaxID=2292705 RepID=A0A371PPD2_9BACL|nr:ATP-binding cassette domain-containing protein [Paenibacillus paeoniae]REK77805.1 ATP-binding cassette domain-containing protein [Paenibacillus paeoniae]
MVNTKSGARLIVDHVSKHFGETPVLQDVTLDIPAGQFVAIVGRSGCGKSTLLRLIAGLEEATNGSMNLAGSLIAGIREETRMLFQDARLLPWKSCVDNVSVVMKSGTREQALDSLRQVGLADKAEEWPSVLSGGQRQRVALARALTGTPSLLLLDEPLGALDALTRLDMQGLIEDIWKERLFTAILVTHDVSEAVALADRVILIENGSIALDIHITLDRPRERDNDFVYFERLILDRLLERNSGERKHARDVVYSI